MAKKDEKTKAPDAVPENDECASRCGIAMPLSDCSGYPEGHWDRVQKILLTAVANHTELEPYVVSDSEDSRIIHTNIAQNLARCPVVVFDVSSKNPNVMMELGLRVGFDRAAIVVKDDETSYSFDAQPIQHVVYRKDLRHDDIEDFERRLGKKVAKTLEAVRKEGDSYSPFASQLGGYEVRRPRAETVTGFEALRRDIAGLKAEMRRERIDRDHERAVRALGSDISWKRFAVDQLRQVAQAASVDAGPRTALVRTLKSTLDEHLEEEGPIASADQLASIIRRVRDKLPRTGLEYEPELALGMVQGLDNPAWFAPGVDQNDLISECRAVLEAVRSRGES